MISAISGRVGVCSGIPIILDGRLMVTEPSFPMLLSDGSGDAWIVFPPLRITASSASETPTPAPSRNRQDKRRLEEDAEYSLFAEHDDDEEEEEEEEDDPENEDDFVDEDEEYGDLEDDLLDDEDDDDL